MFYKNIIKVAKMSNFSFDQWFYEFLGYFRSQKLDDYNNSDFHKTQEALQRQNLSTKELKRTVFKYFLGSSSAKASIVISIAKDPEKAAELILKIEDFIKRSYATLVERKVLYMIDKDRLFNDIQILNAIMTSKEEEEEDKSLLTFLITKRRYRFH